MTQPSFYRTWPSKEAAYLEIIEQTLGRWMTVAGQIFLGPAGLTLDERVGRGVRRLFAELTADPDLTRMVLQETGPDPAHYAAFVLVYDRAFREAQRQGQISAAHSAENLALLFASLTERFFKVRLYTGQRPLDATAREVTGLLLPLLGPPPGPVPGPPHRKEEHP